MKRKLIESTTFAGDQLRVYTHGLDYEIEINGKHYGVFLSLAVALNSAEKYITQTLENKKKG